jgi:hypothetical protein
MLTVDAVKKKAIYEKLKRDITLKKDIAFLHYKFSLSW